MEGGKVVVALGGGRRNFLLKADENGGKRKLNDLVSRFAIALTPNEILMPTK